MSEAEVVVEGYARASQQLTFETIVPIDLTLVFTGFGPLPAVVGRRDQTGPWNQVGASRVVELSDGTEAQEQITAHEPYSYFAYRVGRFTGPLRLAASHADGQWWFAEVGEQQTHIRWSYRVRLDTLLAPAAQPILPRVWRLYARRVLKLAIAEVERVADAQRRTTMQWSPELSRRVPRA